jgi:hypothetical protein
MADLLPKSAVEYESPAKGPDHCSLCKHFEVRHRHGCEIVAGTILPADWCNKFSRRRGFYAKGRS